MELNNLPKIIDKKFRRLGRGQGSGRGKTAGRGTKGQKARGKLRLFFEGGALPLTKRIPFLRGRGRNPVIKQSPVILHFENLNKLPAKSLVDIETLIKSGIIGEEARKYGVKLLGNGEVLRPLRIKIPVSSGAKQKIERAHGTVEV